MPTLEEALATLAVVPPAEFTKARDQLASGLRKAGQAADAAKVKALRKGPPTVWAINRYARDEPAAIDELIEAADQVRAVQLHRAGEAGALAKTMAGYRAALDRLSQRVASHARESGVALTHPLVLRVQNTLSAAAADRSSRALLREGRLEQELAAPGFELFDGAAPRERAATVPRADPDHAPARASRSEAHARAEVERVAAAKRADEAARRATEVERRREADQRRWRERADEARRELSDAEEVAAAAAKAAEGAEARLDELRRQLKAAEADAARQVAEARRAATAVDNARAALRTAEHHLE